MVWDITFIYYFEISSRNWLIIHPNVILTRLSKLAWFAHKTWSCNQLFGFRFFLFILWVMTTKLSFLVKFNNRCGDPNNSSPSTKRAFWKQLCCKRVAAFPIRSQDQIKENQDLSEHLTVIHFRAKSEIIFIFEQWECHIRLNSSSKETLHSLSALVLTQPCYSMYNRGFSEINNPKLHCLQMS